MAAVLIFSAVSVAFLATPQSAYAVVTISSSSNTFYGPGFVRVLVTDTALDETGDSIVPTVEARDGSTVIGSASPTIEAIGSSGTFEFFITTSDFPLMPAAPTKTTDQGTDDATIVNGPFIVRANSLQAPGWSGDAGPGEDANSNPVALSSNSYGLTANMNIVDNFRILYGGQTLVINFDDSTNSLSADRLEAGDDNEIILRLTDNDANSDPTLVDTFSFAAPTSLITSTNAVIYDPATVTLIETGQNTGIFEVTITVNGGALTNDLTATLPTGNSFTARDHSVYEDLSAEGATAPFAAVDPESGTSSVSITLRNRDGAIQLLQTPTLANGLQVQITDRDRNITTEDDDAIAGILVDPDNKVEVFIDFNGNGVEDLGETEAFTFTETGDDTGLFVPDYDDDMITVEVDSTNSFDNVDGIIRLTPAVIADEDIRIRYFDPAFQSNAQFTTITEINTIAGTLSMDAVEAGINDIVTLRLTDPDLNTDANTVETYNAADGQFLINGEPVGFLSILAVNTQFAHPDDPNSDGDEVMPPSAGFEATFIETGPNTGIFEADDVDLGDIDDAPGITLDDGDEIEFTYTDVLEAPEEDDDVTLNIGRPDAGIDTDRSTIPIPTNADPVTIVITVVDPNANVNTGSIDTVEVEVSAVRAGNGNTVAPGDFDEFTGETTYTLRETGPNTGIFEEDVDLQPDAGTTLNELRNARVTFEYEDTFGDTETTSVTYRSYDGVITASPQVVAPGNEFIVRVVDQDGNKDPDEAEDLIVEFDTDENTDVGTLTLEETGPNTGIFEETVEVGVDIVVADVAAGDFTTEIELTYVDAITSSGDTDEDRELTVRVATGTGTLSRVPEIVGPGTEIVVQLGDVDLNENPNGRNSVDQADDLIEINSSDGDKFNLGAEETGPNSGVFEFTIQFEPRDPDEDGTLADPNCEDDCTYTVLPGDIISIQYTDETDSLGNKVLVSMVFEITSQDPEMEAEEPTVQPGESIELTVTDHDANRDGEAQDSIDIDITSDQDPIGFTLAALETGDNTGVFTVSIPTSTTVSSGAIAVRTGSNVYLEYEDEFPADYAERKDIVLDPSKDFTLVVPVGTSGGNVNATTPTAPVLSDLQGRTITSVTVGQQVILNVSIKNNNNAPQPFAGIVEVRDSDGFTQYLQWQTGTINPDATVSVGLSFVPQESGTYTVRTFVLSSVQQATILSPVAQSTFTVS